MDIPPTFPLFFARRLQIDAAKAYAALTIACLFLFANTYYHSFKAPAEASLTKIIGTLEVEPMRRGSRLHVTSTAGTKTTFTCDNGTAVFCPSLQDSFAPGKIVDAFFAPAKPKLLLKLKLGHQELVAYDRMAGRYASRGFNIFYAAATGVFALLFCFSPTIHRPKQPPISRE